MTYRDSFSVEAAVEFTFVNGVSTFRALTAGGFALLAAASAAANAAFCFLCLNVSSRVSQQGRQG